MGENRCPNCRSVRTSDEAKCGHCGWVSLRETELLFLNEQQEFACPSCNSTRPATGDKCPHCGAEQQLAPLSPHTSNFRISSLLLLTALVAVCVGLGRVFVPLGVMAFLLFGLAALRAALLIRERKRYRYPTEDVDMWRFFAVSIGGIMAGSAVFWTTCIFGGAMLGPILFDYRWPSRPVLLIGFLVSATLIGAITLVCWKGRNWRMAAIGALWGLLSSGIVVASSWRFSMDVVATLCILPAATLCLGALFLSCRREGSPHVKAFITGHLSILTMIGIIFELSNYQSGWRAPSLGEIFMLWGFLVVPALLTVLTLEKLWSWDDAFPRAYSRPRQDPLQHARPAMRFGAEVEDEGIEFLADSEQVNR